MACIPPKLQGHVQKKSAVNVMADALEIQTFTFRAGWQVRQFHSAFDYIFNNTQKKDKDRGKTLAGWTRQNDPNYVSTYAPNPDSIVIEKFFFFY